MLFFLKYSKLLTEMGTPKQLAPLPIGGLGGLDPTLPMCFGKAKVFTASEVAAAIGWLKFERAISEDKINLEMLKALNSEEILGKIRVCQVAWKFGKREKNGREA